MAKAQRDHDDRYERWLADLAERLQGHGGGMTTALGYDDRQLGDVMYMSMTVADGYAEVVVLRGDRGAATAILLAESSGVASAVAEAIAGSHRDISRVRNARRKFLHLLERMATSLAHTFDERARRYPTHLLTRLQEIAPEARAMVGTLAHRHIKGARGDHETCYGASIALPSLTGDSSRRALRHNQHLEAFEAYGDDLALLQRAQKDAAGDDGPEAKPVVVPGVAAAYLILSASADAGDITYLTHGSSQSEAVPSVDSCTCVDWISELGCSGCDLADIGGCDTPDCDIFTVPDCDLGCGL